MFHKGYISKMVACIQPIIYSDFLRSVFHLGLVVVCPVGNTHCVSLTRHILYVYILSSGPQIEERKRKYACSCFTKSSHNLTILDLSTGDSLSTSKLLVEIYMYA
jgi:hypothetical protein